MTTADVTTTKRRAKKRADGEGSIRWSEAKKLWIGRVMVGRRLDGKPDTREVSAKTQKLCREKLDAVKLQVASGTLASTAIIGMTVSQFLDRWLESVKPNLREKTHKSYREHVELHFRPALGTTRLAKLTHDDVQAFLNAKRDEKRKRGKSEVTLSPRSLRHLYTILGTALNWGVRKGYLPFSPMLRVDAPRVPTVEITPLTPVQTAKLLDTADAEGDPLTALWTLAAVTGARKSELLGLTWADIDLDAGTLQIRPSAIRDVKTPRSRRTLDLTRDTIAALKAHRDRQAFASATLGDGYSKLGMVFGSTLGTPLDHDNVTKRFKAALRRAKLPSTTRMHDLRHGAATMLLEAGETVPAVSEYLGHSSAAVTMGIYAHAVPGSKKRAAERLGSVLRDARTAPENSKSTESSAS